MRARLKYMTLTQKQQAVCAIVEWFRAISKMRGETEFRLSSQAIIRIYRILRS